MEYIEECFIIFNNTSGEMHETVKRINKRWHLLIRLIVG